MKNGFFAGLIGVVLVMSILIGFQFKAFWSSGPDRVVEAWADGFKAYQTVLYHIRYDSSYSHYRGMNYPYGEHVVPADCQPALSNVARLLAPVFPGISDYSFPLVHFSLLLTFLLCGVLIYLILHKWGVAPWYAVAASAGITFLNPQMERMGGHFGLGHAAAVPLTLYLLLLWDEKPGLRNNAALAAVVVLFSLLHFYLFALLGFFIVLYLLFRYLQQPDKNRLIQSVIALSIQVLLPFAVFYFWMNFQDPAGDRSVSPGGFFKFKLHWEGLLLSEAQPWYAWIDRQVSTIRRLNIENKSYLGIIAGIFALFVTVRWITGLFRKPPIRTPLPSAPAMNAAFYASFVILLFSFGLPFIIKGLEPLLAFTGPIRQFRSVGRFAWVFYYVANLLAFTALFHHFKSKTTWRWLVWVPAFALLGYEAANHTRSFHFQRFPIEEYTAGKGFDAIAGITYANYQASLPVPYFTVGSEIFGYDQQGQVLQKVLVLSEQTGLPTTGAMLTRTSLSQTLKQVQLVTEPYREPAIFKDYPDNRPLLMVWDERFAPPAETRYRHLLDGAGLRFRREGFEPLAFYELPLDSYRRRIDQRRDSILHLLNTDTTLHTSGLMRATVADSRFVYDPMDSDPGVQGYFGVGGKQSDLTEKTFIFTGQMPGGATRHMVSFWMFVNKDFLPRTELEIVEYGPEPGGPRVARLVSNLITAIDNNGWALIELDHQPGSAGNTVSMSLKNYEAGRGTLLVDELLIRPVGVDLYREGPEWVWRNNRWYEKPGQ
ncbi:MAG: hypothetical protein SFV52_12130 [Saprospiraceae bacterium]|nr:hypothetical protein [Saprospiraceae bacterium]